MGVVLAGWRHQLYCFCSLWVRLLITRDLRSSDLFFLLTSQLGCGRAAEDTATWRQLSDCLALEAPPLMSPPWMPLLWMLLPRWPFL